MPKEGDRQSPAVYGWFAELALAGACRLIIFRPARSHAFIVTPTGEVARLQLFEAMQASAESIPRENITTDALDLYNNAMLLRATLESEINRGIENLPVGIIPDASSSGLSTSQPHCQTTSSLWNYLSVVAMSSSNHWETMIMTMPVW